MLRQIWNRLFSTPHDFGVWRTVHSFVFNGKRYTLQVRYCRECGNADFRRKIEEAEEPLRTVSRMLFEVNSKDEIGQNSPSFIDQPEPWNTIFG